MLNRKHIILIAIIGLFLSVEAAGYYIASRGPADFPEAGKHINVKKKSVRSLNRKNSALREKIRTFSPQGIYIMIDTGKNMLYLKRGEQTFLEAVISSGSGNVLTDPSGKKTWTFDTPRGEYRIKSKVVNPEWIKPDWAFVEEGEKIPGQFRDRVEVGMLGDYALSLGDGYLIHGTLYTRLLGRNVTHGCIRIGDRDLKSIYNKTPMGAKVIIY